jgi:hypothetical protein
VHRECLFDELLQLLELLLLHLDWLVQQLFLDWFELKTS